MYDLRITHISMAPWCVFVIPVCLEFPIPVCRFQFDVTVVIIWLLYVDLIGAESLLSLQ